MSASINKQKYRFACQMTKAIQRAGFVGYIGYDPAVFGLKLSAPGDDFAPGVLYLSHAHDEFLRARPAQRPGILDKYARVAITTGHHPGYKSGQVFLARDEALPNLVSCVRARSHYVFGELRDNSHKLFRPFAADLVMGLVLSFPDYVTDVSKQALDYWQLTEDEAFDLGYKNLVDLGGPDFEKTSTGLYFSTRQDWHAPARLLMKGEILKLAVHGAHVVAVPNPNILMVAGSEDLKALEEMVAITEEASKEAVTVSPLPLELRGDEFVPFALSHGPLCLRLRNLGKFDEARLYGMQGKVLFERAREEKAKEIFAATVTCLTLPNGKVENCTVWTEGISNLLPRVDRVAFCRTGMVIPDLRPRPSRKEVRKALTKAFETRTIPEPEVAADASWERVQEVVGHLMSPQGLDPERDLVECFPTDEELAKLGKELFKDLPVKRRA